MLCCRCGARVARLHVRTVTSAPGENAKAVESVPVAPIPNKWDLGLKSCGRSALPAWARYHERASMWNRRVLVPGRMGDPRTINKRPDLEWLLVNQQRASDAMRGADRQTYLAVAFDTLRKLSKLDRLDPLYCNPFLLFVGRASPVHSILADCLYLCFERACIASGTLHVCNNRSGYALCGLKGTGKTVLMQAACIVSHLLLPNFVCALVDVANPNTEAVDEHGNTDAQPRSPQAVLQAALLALCLHDLAAQPHLDSLLAGASGSGFAVGIFADEVRGWYKHEPDSWLQLHSVLQHYTACAFIADSTPTVPQYVRGDEDELTTIGVTGGSVLKALNDDKMMNVDVPVFTTMEHYRSYVQQRLVALHAMPSKLTDAYLGGLHIQSGGRFCGIVDALMARGQTRRHRHNSLRLPRCQSPAVVILWTLLHHATKSGLAFDPFNLPRIAEPRALRILEAALKEGDVPECQQQLSSLQHLNGLSRTVGWQRLAAPRLEQRNTHSRQLFSTFPWRGGHPCSLSHTGRRTVGQNLRSGRPRHSHRE